jgi:urease accessory protein
MQPRALFRSLICSLVALSPALACAAAQAHHVNDGQTPTTSLQGLLSGMAHPVLEWDHLLFLLGAAALVAAAKVSVGRAVQLLGAFAVAASIGTAGHASGLNLPWAEASVAISLVVLALALLRITPRLSALLALAVGGGLSHGYAYGESIAGAAPSPTMAYELGLLLVQAALLCLVYSSWSRVIERSPVFRPSARRGLALVVGVVGAFGLSVAA